MKTYLMVMLSVILVSGCGSPQAPQSQQSSTDKKSMAKMANPIATAESNQLIEEGKAYLGSGNVTAAIKSFGQAIMKNPSNTQPYIILGQTYMRLENYDRAAETFLQLTKVDPTNGEAYYLLAVCNGLAGDKAQAKANAQKSVEIFQAKKDEKNFIRSISLLQGILQAENEAPAKDANSSLETGQPL